MNRVISYIDGFNLYYGMRAKRWPRYFWLDLHKLCENILKRDQKLIHVNYYTARISSTPSDPHKAKRQNSYLDALGSLPNVTITYGKYLRKPFTCWECGATLMVPEEKMTDVNIAVDLLKDAFEDRFDTALLISGDSDLTGPIGTIRRLFPNKRVVVAFPPQRSSKDLRDIADASFQIGRVKLAASQLPNQVESARGFIIHRPQEWK
jgi:uncharacterized LabA/DUF88 family protein